MWHGAWCWQLWQELFAEWGWETHAHSLPGHAGSPTQRPIARCTLDYYLSFLKAQVACLPQRPVLMGHSMGGLIAAYYAFEHQNILKGLILSAPVLKIAMNIPSWQITLSKNLARILPKLTVNNGIDAADLCRDETVVKGYRKDPLTHSLISLSLFREMVLAGERCTNELFKIKIPTLLLFGGNDLIVDYKTAHDVFLKLENDKNKEILLENNYHEILNEFDKESTFEQIYEWLKTILYDS